MGYLENDIIKGKLFIIDHELLLKENEFSLFVWNEWYKFILERNFKFIFVHNLGNFDGYYIYKILNQLCEPNLLNTIIDHHNNFITITLNIKFLKFTFLDSYRIFNVSLEDFVIHLMYKVN